MTHAERLDHLCSMSEHQGAARAFMLASDLARESGEKGLHIIFTTLARVELDQTKPPEKESE